MAERKHAPTPRRLREAYARGERPVGRTLIGGASIAAAALALERWGAGLIDALSHAVLHACDVGDSVAPSLALLALDEVVSASVPIVTSIVGVSVLVGAAQAGGVLAPGAVAARAERLDPARGLGRLFSLERLGEIAWSLLVLVVILGVTTATLRESLRGVLALSAADGAHLGRAMGALSTTLLWRGGLALVVLGAAELGWRRWRAWRELHMTDEELRKETRDDEGDPAIERARERVRREIAAQDASERASEAALVVHDGDRLAVAIGWDGEDAHVPTIDAIGRDALATRMLDAALRAEVPTCDDAELAALLADTTRHSEGAGGALPEALYDRVALALVEARER
jgi:flagellar biosynthesis protein FlhB